MAEFMILREETISLMESKIQRYVSAGWRPVGGLTLAPEGWPQAWLQSMIKEPVEQTREPRSP